jgi:peptide/nickel transport system ATP-binding protein
MDALLTVDSLRVRFAGAKEDTLKGVSLELRRGEMLALVGESGSGKTLLCRTALGLPPRNAKVSGEIRASAQMSLVLQEPMASLDPAMPIGKQILEAMPKKSKAEVSELLRKVGIPDPEQSQHSFPSQFSGGMRQRAAIAIALAMKPGILFADEPTTSLDAKLAEGVMGLFSDIAKQGTAVLFVTHDLSLVERHADRVAYIRRGEMVDSIAFDRILPHSHKNAPLLGEALLKAENVSKLYKPERGPAKRVLSGASLEIFRGETVGLSGRSGIGKSTFARILCGLEKPSGGSVTNCAASTRTIFQDSRSALNPRMAIGQLLAEPLKLSGRRPDHGELADLLERVELSPSLIGRYPHEISGGERQRVAIARAVSTNPELIIADEPVSSLDAGVQRKIMHLLRKLKDGSGLSLLLISHDTDLLEHVCDRVVQLDEAQ